MSRKKQCLNCGHAALTQGQSTVTCRLAGVTYQTRLPALVCPACDEARLTEEVVEAYERALADQVARGPAGGDALRFLRKWLGLTAAQLGALLSTTPESVSRWENQVHAIPQPVFWIIAQAVQDALAGHHQTLDSLQQYAARQQEPPGVVEILLPTPISARAPGVDTLASPG
jgi:DNA-binding transcriptional regulator YiaG